MLHRCAVFVGVFKDNDKEGRKWARAAKNCLFVQLSSAFFVLKLLLCNNNTSPISKDAVGRAVWNCTENFLGKTFVKYDSGGCNFFLVTFILCIYIGCSLDRFIETLFWNFQNYQGGTQNQGKGRYLSETPFLTFVYLSKCNTKPLDIFGDFQKKVFMNRSSVHDIIPTKVKVDLLLGNATSVY